MIAIGRNLILWMENPSVPGDLHIVAKCRTNGWAVNNEQNNVSKGDGTRWRKLLKGGVQSLSTTAEGVFSDDVTMGWVTDLQDSGKQARFRIEDGLGGVIEGFFRIPSFTTNGPHNGAQTYSFSMTGSGRPLIYNIRSGGPAKGGGAAGGFPGPGTGIALPSPGPPPPSYPPDRFSQVSPYVGSGAGTPGGRFYKMMGVFNVATVGAIPTFTGTDIYAGLVCPDGTAQMLDGSPLTQVGLYLMYGYVTTQLVMNSAGLANEAYDYNIQFNAQNQTFGVTRPGITFSGSLPVFLLASGPSGGPVAFTPRPLVAVFDYTLALDTSPRTESHFGADIATWTPSFGSGIVGGSLSWSDFASGDGIEYFFVPFGTITNDDPYPTPPVGSVFGAGSEPPVQSLNYGVNGNGMSDAGMDAVQRVQQTY